MKNATSNDVTDIVEAFRSKGFLITDDTVDTLKKKCIRKIDMNGIENRDEYIPILFADELKDYLIGNFLNSLSIAIMKGDRINVQHMFTDTVPSEMSECTGT